MPMFKKHKKWLLITLEAVFVWCEIFPQKKKWGKDCGNGEIVTCNASTRALRICAMYFNLT